MYLKCHERKKNGKVHRYWSVIESYRLANGSSAKRQVLYLGEINDSQKLGWCKVIEALEGRQQLPRQVALFPSDRSPPAQLPQSISAVNVDLSGFELHRPRQWGACWLALKLWDLLLLDQFFQPLLPASRKGTDWYKILQLLVCNRLIQPGSEWFVHRHWYRHTALSDLLGLEKDIVAKNALYECHDRLLEHKEALFTHLKDRWQDLFEAKFEVLLYDLTSTYFESNPPLAQGDKRQYGYSRDKRQDCVQVVIALVVTPEGFPLTYEVLAGNTQDKQTLPEFLDHIEKLYGKAQRIWVMDRGIPTEEILEQMRASEPPIYYVVGTPRGHLSKYEKKFLEHDWHSVRAGVEVKQLNESGEILLLAKSQDRVSKERSMRRRKLRKLWERLKEIAVIKNQSRDDLLLRLGGAKKQAGRAWYLVKINVPPAGESAEAFSFKLNLKKLRRAYGREGRYLLRASIPDSMEPQELWRQYIGLSEIEASFKTLKGDLAVRPVHHQLQARIEAHIFVSFLAYCLHVVLRAKLRTLAGGLTPRAVLEKLAALQMIDVHFPTTEGGKLVMPRYTQPDQDLKLLLVRMGMDLPEQPPPRIEADRSIHFDHKACGADF